MSVEEDNGKWAERRGWKRRVEEGMEENGEEEDGYGKKIGGGILARNKVSRKDDIKKYV